MINKHKGIKLFSVIFVLLVLVSAIVNFYQTRQEVKQDLNSTVQMKVSLVHADNTAKLYLSNNQTENKPIISAFQIHLTTSLSSDEYELKINPILQNQNWTFPLVKKEGNELKISGFRMGSTPYEITNSGILFFTLIPNTNKAININLVKNNTLFYDNNAQPTITYTVLSY